MPMYFFRTFRAILLLAFLCLAVQPLAAQEDLVKKQAAVLFDKGDYPAALPLYSQLLSNYPKDPNYNYRFGVCMLFGNADKTKSLQYLEFASKNPETEKDVWFYLGRAYHLNYRFDDAIKAYTKYSELAGEKKAEKLQVSNQIAMCRTGKKLLRAITDIEVLEKKELPRADFFRSYDLSGYSGSLLVKPDEFKTALDKKNNETSIIFLSGEKNELYYSSYGDNEENGKDIYIVRKLPNGSWSKPQNVGYPINTEYDEDYPFLHPNGKVLYFSSKGHSSMGGYDIFRSELNEETNTWLKPVNLDFAINTPDDDILYITDFEEKSAYFASSRSSPDGLMTVYHVNIERKPVDYCLIKGNVIPMEDQPSRSARIIVKNLETDAMVGIFKSNEQTGDYLLNLPNGGKFEFTVEKNGMETQQELVLVPPQYQIKPVRQELGYKEMNGKQELYVMTFFDDDTAGLSPDFLRDKAKLDVNASAPREVVDLGAQQDGNKDPQHAGNETQTAATAQTSGGNEQGSKPAAVTNEQLVNIAYEDAATAKTEAAESKAEAERALSYAAELNTQTREKQAEADQAKAAGNTAEAARLQSEADALRLQTVAAYNQADALDRDAAASQKEADLSQQYAKQLDAAVKSKKPGEIEKLEKDQQQLELLSESRSEAAATLGNLQNTADTKRAEAEKVEQQVADLKSEISEAKAQADKLRADAKAERDKDARAGLEQQAAGIDEDIALNTADLKKAEEKAQRLRNESNLADQQLAGASQTNAQARNANYTPDRIDATAKQELLADVRKYEKQVEEFGGTSIPAATTAATQQSAGSQQTAEVADGGTETQTAETDTAASVTETSTNTTTDLAAAAEKYAQALKAADTIANAQTAAERKVELDTQRAEELKTASAEKRTAAKNTTDKTQRAALNAEADQLDKELKAVQQATAVHEKELQQARAVAATVQTAAAPINTNYSAQLQNVSAATPAERSTAEAAVYSGWADALNAEAAKYEKQAAAQRKLELKAQNEAAAKALRTQAEEKQELAQKATEAAEPVAQSAEPNSTSPTAAKTEVQLNSVQAQQQLAARTETLRTAETQRSRRDSLNTAAAATQGAERDRLQREATAVQRELWNTEALAAQQLGDANTAEFNNNAAELAALKTAAAGNSSNEAETAGMLAVEAENLMQQAAAERKAAAAATNDPYTRNENLNAAAEHEKQALLKQQQSAERYKAAGITASSAAVVTQPQTQSGTAETQTPVASETNAAAGTPEAQIAAPFTEQLKAAAAITDPAAKARRESEIYDAWAEKLDNTITEKQEKLSAATTEKERKQLNAEITALQTELDKRQEQAVASISKAQQLEQQTTSTASTETQQTQSGGTETQQTQNSGTETQTQITPENSAASETPEAKLGAPFAAQLEAAAAITDPAARARRESEIYDAWAEKIDSTIIAKQQKLNNTRSAAEKKTLNSDIAALQAELDKRQTQAASAVTRAQELEQQTASTQTQQTDPGAGTQTQQTAATETQQTQSGGTEAQTQQTVSTQTQQTDPGAQTQTQQTEPGTQTQQTSSTQPQQPGSTDPFNETGEPKIVGVVINPATGEPFKEDELEVVRNSDAYKNYAALATEADEAAIETASQRRQAAKYEASGNAHIEEAQRFVDLASNENNEAKRQQYFNEATRENQLARDDFAKRDSVNELAENTDASARAKRNEAELFLQEVDKTNYEQVKAVTQAENIGNPVLPPASVQTQTETQPVNTSTQPGNNAQTASNMQPGNNAQTASNTQPGSNTQPASNTQPGSTTPPATAQGESFRISPGVRTNAAAIPMNPQLPEGLVFKVQVGAFRNPIPAGTFDGISPLTGETTPQGFTRYTAGLFMKFNNANAAKQQIRNMGYRDAFVVAFYNGKRITLAEALRLSGETVSAEVLADAAGVRSGTTPGNTSQQGTTQPGGTTTNAGTTPAAGNTTAAGTVVANAAPSRDVAAVSGLFYTVQVGVFSAPVTSARLYNLSNLNTERLPNGNLRYSSGSYNNLNAAVSAKSGIVSTGISDAFVTAYYNGRRITVAEARLLEQQGTQPASTTQSAPQTQQPSAPQNQPASQPAAGLPFSQQVSSSAPVTDSGIVYTVQLGAFREQVPVAVANRFIELSGRGVRHYVNPDNGFTVFMTAPVNSYEAAVALREECAAKGISDAFVAAWKNGKRIPVAQARNGG